MKNSNLSGGLFSKKPLTPKETAVSGLIAEYLDRRGIYNDRLNAGGAKQGNRFIRLCKSGTPDRFCILRGRIVFIEVKMFGATPTPEQLERQQELLSAGAIVINTDSEGDFIRQFTTLEQLI